MTIARDKRRVPIASPLAGILALAPALSISPATSAHAPSDSNAQVVGGLGRLDSYCKARGFADVIDPSQVHTAGDWKCVSSDGSMPITNDPKSLGNLTWDEACDLFYGIKFGDVRPINAAPSDPPFSVTCVK
jgi:hypothetical protein